MTTFLATLLVFLCTALALGLGRMRGRRSDDDCGGCAAREFGGCGKGETTLHQGGENDDGG